MKPQTKSGVSRAGHGFTLMELLISMMTTVILVGGIVAVSLYATRMLQFTKPKLGASDDARRAISLLTDEIREARDLDVGVGTLTTFVQASNFSPQIGNSLRIFPIAGNTNKFIKYFWDSTDNQLKRTTNNSTATFVVCSYVSNKNNECVFRVEDCFGNAMNEHVNNRVIAMTLQFNQIQYPITPVGPGNYYDFYQLRMKATRRAYGN